MMARRNDAKKHVEGENVPQSRASLKDFCRQARLHEVRKAGTKKAQAGQQKDKRVLHTLLLLSP
jgi:hypothetical protein